MTFCTENGRRVTLAAHESLASFVQHDAWPRLPRVITSVRIEGFRGVREGGVEGLAPISILVGPNNTGKSTVLEAIAVAEFAPDARAIAELVLRRGGPSLDALARAVARGAEHASVTVHSDIEGPAQERRATLRVGGIMQIPWAEEARREGLRDPMELLTVQAWAGTSRIGEGTSLVDIRGCRSENFVDGHDPKHTVTLVDVEAIRRDGALEDAYTRIDEAGQLPTVVKALARSMPGLADLRILKVNGDFLLHTFFASGHPVPAFLAGDGFKRFLELAAAVVNLRKDVVLLEEPESFQHPRYLRELAALLFISAREGKQVILSTHSIELIDRILQAPEAEGLPYPAVHRLSLYDGSLRATTLDHEHALRIREDLLQDLRA